MIIETVFDLQKAYEWLTKQEKVAYDIETNGLNHRHVGNCIIGIGVSNFSGGYYLPIHRFNVGLDCLETHAMSGYAQEFVSRIAQKKLITFNGAFDLPWSEAELGVTGLLEALYCDVLLLKHTVDEEFPFRLKEIAVQVFGYGAASQQRDLQAQLKERGASKGEIYKAHYTLVGKYCIQDCLLTYRLFQHYNAKLASEGLTKFFYEDEVMPLYKYVTIPMEQRGIAIDEPAMRTALREITADIQELEQSILKQIEPNLGLFTKWFLDKDYPPSRSGNFAQAIVRYAGHDALLPITDGGKYSLAKKDLLKLPEGHFKQVLLKQEMLTEQEIKDVQRQLATYDHGFKSLFNLQSKHHLKKLFFDTLGLKPLSTTELGSPQVDDEFISSIKHQFAWANDLHVYNKLQKLKATYIERFLDGAISGIFYPSFFQHRTVSGRLAGDFQQLPRPVKPGSEHTLVTKYTNLIRAFFIARPGHVFADADYESAEPRVFAHVSGDEGLKDIYRQNKDFYSEIAIRTEALQGYSSIKTESNYLGKAAPERRQDAKAYCFAADTLVNAKQGQVPIQNLKVGDKVWTKIGFKPVTKTFSRTAATVLVHTNKGILECTPDHKFFIQGEWVEAQSLQKGQLLTLSENMATENYVAPKLPIMSNMSFAKSGARPIGHLEVCEEWGYVIGALLGDGIISIKQTKNMHGHGLKGYVGICGLPEDLVVKKVAEFMATLGFPLKDRTHEKKRCKNFVAINSELCKIVYDTLQLGNINAVRKCKNLKVPDYMFNAPTNVKLAFIAGLLDTDGFVKVIQNTRICAFTSKDTRLSTGVQVLLQTMGISSTMEPQWNKPYNKWYWTIRIPIQSMKQLCELNIQRHMVVPRKKAAFTDVVVNQRKASKSPQVLRVESSGHEVPVYDITVADAHHFFANGILVHNCLGVPYGMTGYKLQFELNIPQEEADKKVEAYLSAFPGLRAWMQSTQDLVVKQGFIRTLGGRIRHLPKAKEYYTKYGLLVLDSLQLYKDYAHDPHTYEHMKKVRRELKNCINNAVNVQIQSTVASMINRASIAIAKQFTAEELPAKIVAQIHDQLIVECAENCKERVADIMQDRMENTMKFDVHIPAKPNFGLNMKESKGA